MIHGIFVIRYMSLNYLVGGYFFLISFKESRVGSEINIL
jgi:hypothetical protein